MAKFGTKGQTLINLRPLMPENTLETMLIKASDIQNNPQQALSQIRQQFNENIVIRSSSSNEDLLSTSNAGKYQSVIGVTPTDENILENIRHVFQSYDKFESDEHVVIQKELTEVEFSGVVTSRHQDTGAPYFVINMHIGSDTALVTSGKSNDFRQIFIRRDSKNSIKEKKILELIQLTTRLEQIFSTDWLDIEFAFSTGKCFILQVRPIVKKDKKIGDEEIFQYVDTYKEAFTHFQSEKYSTFGSRAVFSNMADWNPAEIIGTRPKAFASSLYKEVITDSTWAYQRSKYGYKNLRSTRLMHLFGGQPFIDCRASFSSFLPASVSRPLCEKLIDSYLEKLVKEPSLHDKVEFEIVATSYEFDLHKRLETSAVIDDAQVNKIVFELWRITNDVLFREQSHVDLDIEKISKLPKKLSDVLQGNFSSTEKIFWLTQDVKRFGTLPFAGLARAAFMAVVLIRSLHRLNAVTGEELELFFETCNTVSKQMKLDSNSLDRYEFIGKYGHLRPGTYDIETPTYGTNFEAYFPNGLIGSSDRIETSTQAFDISTESNKKVADLLISHRFEIEVPKFFDKLRQVIEAREFAKFEFTKHLSQIISLTKTHLLARGFEPHELAFVDFQHFVNGCMGFEVAEFEAEVKNKISKNQKAYELGNYVKLPDIICDNKDFVYFESLQNKPNFITNKTIIAPPAFIEDEGSGRDLSGKIAIIRAADPGYDYLFSQKISGLITCFGGANSHMAIRCAELSLPAAIGVGEILYKNLTQSDCSILLDCSSKVINLI